MSESRTDPDEVFMIIGLSVAVVMLISLLIWVTLTSRQANEQHRECRESCTPLQNKIIDDRCFCATPRGGWDPQEVE